jgi:hypothetical protein
MRRLEKRVQFIFYDALELDEANLVRKATAAVVNKLDEDEQVIDSLLPPPKQVAVALPSRARDLTASERLSGLKHPNLLVLLQTASG